MNITFLNKLRVAQIPPPLFKYFRLIKLTGGGAPTIDYQGIKDWKLYTGKNKTGIVYPTTILTSNTSAAGVTTSAGYSYSSGYAPWNAFDLDNNGMWWSLGGSVAANNWLQIAFNTDKDIRSMEIIHAWSQTSNYLCKIYGSNTGTFTGEQVFLGQFYTTTSSNNTAALINI